MKPRNILLYCLLVLFADKALAQAPVEFIENKGQWNEWFSYKAATPAGDVYLEKDGFRYVLQDGDNNFKVDYYHHGQTTVKPTLKFHVYKVTFEGANIPEMRGEKEQKVYYNYFLGNDPSKWKSEIHPFYAINYNQLYNGIDMHISSEKGNIIYEFMVKPGADASQIKLKFDGPDAIKIKNSNLVISTSVGEVKEMKPYVYQYINNNRVEVPCEYKLKGNELTFNFPEDYDHTQQLIIDPVVVLCTLTGSTADNWGYSATYDDAGNFYAGGLVNTLAFGGTFPVSPGAFQLTFGGGATTIVGGVYVAYAADISIIKYDATLATKVYATYLGGLQNDHVHSMIVDPAGNLIVAGRTLSQNFPVTTGCYQNANKGWWDIIVTKFNSTGTALLGSTYIGGSESDGVNFDSTETGFGQTKYNYGDDSRSEVQLDNAGNIYVTSCTNSTDFPTKLAISSTLKGVQDGVVFKFNSSLTNLLWSTYIGGGGYDAGYVLGFDTLQQSVYVAGGTTSADFPVTAGTFHSTYQGGLTDGFILKFDNTGAYTLQKGTFIGTSGYDQVYGIQGVGKNIFAMGQTLGGTFPVTPGTYSDPGSSQFVIELDNNLTINRASTVFGSGTSTSTNISPVAFLVDTCSNVYISGWGGNLGITSSASGWCTGMPTTTDGFQLTTDGMDFYFIVLGSGLSTLRYASYYGRSCTSPAYYWMNEHVDGGTSRFDRHGIIYQGICASCGGAPSVGGSCPSPFPTTAGVWATVDGSLNCNEAALRIAFNIGPVTANVTAGPNTSGCAPLTVNFTNTSTNGLTYLWNFGDGSPTSTSFSASHTFTSAGTYTVTLSAANSNACFRANDTAYVIIRVDTNAITPSFTYVLTDSCGPYTVVFTNTSTDKATGPPSYQWIFGDGTTFAGVTPPTHNYPDTGIYQVILIMSDPSACKTPDSTMQTIHIYGVNVSANFTLPDSVCLGTPITPLETVKNAVTSTWTFGDRSYPSGSGIHKYDSVGTYTVTLIVQNNNACNKADTIVEKITVLPVPTANFTFQPTNPIPNVPVTFTNLSINATRYAWDFGDNTNSADVNPVHQYNKTGNYNVCLNAYNMSSCPSVMCKKVPSEVNPLIGIPTAFSPNGDGENDILYVRGAAIQTLDLKIFNRWGQLVFETTSKEKGWDGTFGGQPQPMDAYAYVLNATFIDGTAKILKGNITLLR
jgi:gliding motility-associated-like protein